MQQRWNIVLSFACAVGALGALGGCQRPVQRVKPVAEIDVMAQLRAEQIKEIYGTVAFVYRRL